MTSVPLHTVTWPAERFYWATLPAEIIRRDGVLEPGAIEAVRDQIPAPMEHLHAVAAMTTKRAQAELGSGGGSEDGGERGDRCGGIVCAIEIEQLRTLDAGTLMLTPESIPACVLPPGMGAPDPSRLNLLTGEFEPRAIRSHRHRRAALVLGAIAISCMAISLDLSRRAELQRRAAQDDAEAAQGVLAQAALAQNSGSPDALALERELEQLRAVASRAGRGASFDAPKALTEIVGAWPSTEGALPQSLNVRADASTITVRTAGAPAAFLSAWRTPAGWSSAEPRVQAGSQAGSDGGIVTLELKQLTATGPKGGAP